MKNAILIGAGAEIGSNLLLQNDPQADGFIITSVITNPPPTDKHYPHLRPIDGIFAKLALASPGVHSNIKILSDNELSIDGRTITFYFGNIKVDKIEIPDVFDIAFLATSKNDISATSDLMVKLKSFCNIILGVAEADNLPSIYSCLVDLTPSDIPTIKCRTITEGIFCLGSCQTNGMHASLRVMLEAIRPLNLNAQSIISIATDIVHPDTPNGVLGTRSFEGRMQDARDNLRPSFSQIAQSQGKVLPWAPLINTVSLRAPVHAPGYQINRFIIEDHGALTLDHINFAINSIYNQSPHIVKRTDTPLGSRAYSNDKRCATILTDPHHLIISRPEYLSKQNLSEIIMQSFVSNTVGYASLVINIARNISNNIPVAVFKGL